LKNPPKAEGTGKRERVQRAPRVPRAQKEERKTPDEGKKGPLEEDLKLSRSGFDRRIKEVIAMRGKKGTDLGDQLSQLRKLAHYSRRLGPARQLIATMYIVGAQMFDTSSKIDKVLSTRLWKLAHNDMLTIMEILEKNPGFTLAPLSSEDQADILRAGRGELAEDDEDDNDENDPLPKAGQSGLIKVSGDLAAFIERLNDEYVKSLQQTDPHTSEYITRLYDEGLLVDLASMAQKYFVRQQDYVRAANVALIRAELLYYKHESIAKALNASRAKRSVYGDPLMLHPASEGSMTTKVSIKNFDPSQIHPGSIMGQPTVEVPDIDVEKELGELCLFVYKHSDDRAKTRAMLCHIYHHALHDRFHEARDLLLMSHLQETITHTDIPTQILFNRMMAQLGLCAFRNGLMWESHACLSEICTGSKTKELLAQGLTSFRNQERDVEQERLERRRQVPYHMHINLELLETCHLTSAMLLEVPNMVQSRVNERKRVVSKAFRKLLEFHERLVFAGPPENTRDHIVAAAKHLAQGAWQKSVELVIGLNAWDLLPGEGIPARVKDMVRQKIQVESLRTYLLAYSDEYDSLNLNQLTEMFELDQKTVHSVVSKMMINEELQGAWDQGSQSIVLHKVQRTRLQQLALHISDKIGTIVENNERMMDLRSVSFNSKDDHGRRGDNRNRHQQNDNRNRNQTGGNNNSGHRGGNQYKKGGNNGHKKQQQNATKRW